jgi:hypothetical protein
MSDTKDEAAVTAMPKQIAEGTINFGGIPLRVAVLDNSGAPIAEGERE